MTKLDMCRLILKLVGARYDNYVGSKCVNSHCDVINRFIDDKKYNSVFVYVSCIIDINDMQEDFLNSLNDISKQVHKEIQRLRQTTNWNDETIANNIGKDIDDGKYEKCVRSNAK